MKNLGIVSASALMAIVLAGCASPTSEPFDWDKLSSKVDKPRSTVSDTPSSPLPQIKSFDMKRCVNMGNSFEAPKNDPWGKPINPADFATIRAKGFDTVRIPVRWSDYLADAPGYEIDADFMSQVETAVNAALAADLNVILNMHHNEDIVDDPVAAMPAYLAAWEQIADRFKDAPDDLWFETLNEPYGALKGDIMRRAQREGVATIRKTNPDRVIILGGEEWSGIRTLDTNIAPPDENIVYTFHYYDPFEFTHQKAFWLGDAMPKGTRGWGNAANRTELDAAVQTAVDYRAKINRPVFMGEFGANSPIDNDQRVKWARAVRQEMEGGQIPWCLWSYSNTFALYDNDTNTWDEDMLDALLGE